MSSCTSFILALPPTCALNLLTCITILLCSYTPYSTFSLPYFRLECTCKLYSAPPVHSSTVSYLYIKPSYLYNVFLCSYTRPYSNFSLSGRNAPVIDVQLHSFHSSTASCLYIKLSYLYNYFPLLLHSSLLHPFLTLF